MDQVIKKDQVSLYLFHRTSIPNCGTNFLYKSSPKFLILPQWSDEINLIWSHQSRVYFDMLWFWPELSLFDAAWQIFGLVKKILKNRKYFFITLTIFFFILLLSFKISCIFLHFLYKVALDTYKLLRYKKDCFKMLVFKSSRVNVESK